MVIDVLSFDPFLLNNSDVIHIRIENKEQVSKFTQDFVNRFPHLRKKILVTTSGINMVKFTKKELLEVRNDINKILNDINKILGETNISQSNSSIKEEKKVISTSKYEKCFRVRHKRTKSFEKSSNGKTIWLRKPNLKSMYLNEKDYEIVTFEMKEIQE